MSTTPFRPTPCSAVLDPQCVQPIDSDDDGGNPFKPPLPDLGEIGGNVLDDIAKAFRDAVGWLISNTSSWWVQVSAPNLEQEPAIGLLQSLTQPLTIAVAMMALFVAAAKMALTHKANPLIDVGRGLTVLAVVTTIGAVLPNKLLQWGSEWTTWVLSASSQGDFATRMAKIVAFPSGTPAVMVILLCLVALVIGLIQAFLMLFRGAALIILAGVLPLAAAGLITPATQPWFKKVTGWGLALIFYQPAAGAVYATAFILIGDGQSMHAVLMGFTMMLISLIAFPVLLKFFNWTTSAAESSNAGGILGTVLNGAMTLGALRSYTAYSGSRDTQNGSAGEHAKFLRQQLGEQNPEHQNPHHQGNENPTGADSRLDSTGMGQDGDAPTRTTVRQPSTTEQSQDPTAPTGSGAQPHGSHSTGQQSGQASTADGSEPVGPAGLGAWDQGRRASTDSIRWMGEPTGSGNAGGPTGAGGGGGGGA
ncbi:hypothetical protein SMC26_24010 [Actinomadura fulvescens]|uniref:Type IV secretion system protein n=1 Tax=Actinomadura fulvescens TaxID=46160 RepID=A0ABN3Q621_9ACTN